MNEMPSNPMPNPEDDLQPEYRFGYQKAKLNRFAVRNDIDSTSSAALDPAKTGWNFVEVWIDPLLSPPYLLLLMGEPSGSCRIHDPADSYKVVFSSSTYDEAQTWLLEDEYEPVEGRFAASEL